MRCQDDDYLIFRRQLPDIGPEVFPRLRIEAQRRLVQKQDLRIVQESPCRFQTSAHPAGLFSHPDMLLVGKVHKFQSFIYLPVYFGPPDPVHQRMQIEIFPAGQQIVRTRVLKNKSCAPPDPGRVFHGVMSADQSLTAGGRQKCGSRIRPNRLRRQ